MTGSVRSDIERVGRTVVIAVFTGGDGRIDVQISQRCVAVAFNTVDGWSEMVAAYPIGVCIVGNECEGISDGRACGSHAEKSERAAGVVNGIRLISIIAGSVSVDISGIERGPGVI